ncbi:PepSY-associated TM helix domain-containing protein [Methylocystis heyeri]|uniref:PepSY-associated TM helix domain-containing protein n=1 Tax=Methylocystis heyeri TaxID=391905 RepID=UPI0011399289|nr:PepSY-associated TM helix domain-containing protein [Methylocystis heyeri]
MITRSLWVVVHRWTGLAMAAFLIVVGLTGSVLAFFGELNHWLSPELFPEPRPGVRLDAGTLARSAEELVPQARTSSVYLGFAGTAMVRMEPRPGAAQKLDFQQLMLDPIDGHELGRREAGGLPTGLATIIPFVYQLHMNLLMGPTGAWILGIVALVWTLDCFNGFYLTLPVPSRAARNGYFARWRPAWMVKWPASSYRLNFDLHRAGGLWLWAMLLVFAWSSVSFHLNGVYAAATRLFLAYEEPLMKHEAEPAPAQKNRKPLGWEEAQAIGVRLMDEQARNHDFKIDRPNALSYMRARGLYGYSVHSSRDVGEKYGSTTVYFDAYSGEFHALGLPSGEHAGNTLTSWLVALHMANLFGLPYKIFVCALGFAITMLSGTGVYIWLRKRRARKRIPSQKRVAPEPLTIAAQASAE